MSLALYQPLLGDSDPWNVSLNMVELVFNAMFSLEMVLRCGALLLGRPRARGVEGVELAGPPTAFGSLLRQAEALRGVQLGRPEHMHAAVPRHGRCADGLPSSSITLAPAPASPRLAGSCRLAA